MRPRSLTLFLAAALALPAFDSMRDKQATIAVAKMNGLETIVERALKSRNLAVAVSDQGHDFEVRLEKRYGSEHTAALMRAKLGRVEDHSLVLVTREGKTAAFLPFQLGVGRDREAALEFAAAAAKAVDRWERAGN